MAEPTRTFVVLDSGVNQDEVGRMLPKSDEIEIVGLVTGIDDAWVRLHETANDLLIIVSSGHSEPVLNLIDSAVVERPRRPVVVLSYGSPNGFTRRVFAAGADDVLMLPATSDEVLFALQKAIARKAGADGGGAFIRAPLICIRGVHQGAADLHPRAQGRHGQDVDLDLALGCARRGR